MRATTQGHVKYSRVRRGGKGTSAPEVLFSYTVDGRGYESDRFAPGLSQGCTSTGGGRAAEDYRDGQDVVVHYDPDRPYDACLAWGWSPLSIFLPCFLLGMGVRGRGRELPGRRGMIFRASGVALAFTGASAMILVPGVLAPAQIPIALAVVAGLFVLSLGFHRATGR